MRELLENWNLVEFNYLSVLVRLLLAMVCSGILGLERTRKRRPAGIRTYMLVCIGATVVMMTAQFMNQHWGGDPGRLPAQVISGIGFLGAGTIMMTKHYRILGLTTAAGLWASACIGLAIGVGFYFGAILTTLILVLVVVLVDEFEKQYSKNLHRVHVFVILTDIVCLKSLIQYMRSKDITVGNVELTSSSGVSGIGLFCVLKLPRHVTQDEAMQLVTEYHDVIFVERTDE
ncbi:MAG: MgtC/SapB family protein [Oscillospiraceae bacterium]|nr:MgtC/SapB family protein [Oscillospiraceae bacterium]